MRFLRLAAEISQASTLRDFDQDIIAADELSLVGPQDRRSARTRQDILAVRIACALCTAVLVD